LVERALAARFRPEVEERGQSLVDGVISIEYLLDMPKKNMPETPLYVRLPATAGDKLDRAAEALGIPKKELVAGLVDRYVDPDSQRGLFALGTLSQPRFAGAEHSSSTPLSGTHSFQPYDAPEVLNAEQAARLLQVDEALLVELAEGHQLPGRKLGTEWRFSRAALIAWLSTTVP
jgi:excisionase family DNA binding protein